MCDINELLPQFVLHEMLRITKLNNTGDVVSSNIISSLLNFSKRELYLDSSCCVSDSFCCLRVDRNSRRSAK